MNGMSKWIVMAGLVASATLGVRSVSQAADPLVDHGALESVAGPLAKILVLKIEGERLRLDRDAWAAPFGGKSIAQLEKEIDEEIRLIVETAHDKAKSLIEAHLAQLHLMADALMKYESIDGKQINQIMEGREPDPPDGWNENDNGEKAKASDDREKSAPIGGPAEQV